MTNRQTVRQKSLIVLVAGAAALYAANGGGSTVRQYTGVNTYDSTTNKVLKLGGTGAVLAGAAGLLMAPFYKKRED